jgi:hypothetical protein
MISLNMTEYRRLEIDSSNLLLEADRCRAAGWYELSAYAMLNAGRARLRMGQIVFTNSAVELAVEDWLSSAACFLQASDDKRAEVPLDIVRGLKTNNRIPPERHDLLEALQKHENGLSLLKVQVSIFLRGLASPGFRLESPNQESLNDLLEQIPKLPGYPQLHYLIFRLASGLGERDLAALHIHWATTFEPDNPNYAALLGYQFIELGKPESAVSAGREFLVSNHIEAGPVRIMIANAMATTLGNRAPDREGAIRTLLPVIEDTATRIKLRIAAMSLCAVLKYELGQVEESNQLFDDIADIAYSTGDNKTFEIVRKFRQMLPRQQELSVATLTSHTLELSEESRNSAFAAARDLAFN